MILSMNDTSTISKFFLAVCRMPRKPIDYLALRSSNIVEEVNNEEPFRPRPRTKRQKRESGEQPPSSLETDG